MAGETTITIIGNLTANPELKVTNRGDSVAGFTVASTPRTLDKASGEWRDGEPLFLRCSAWRDMAESISQSLTKGARVIVTGRLKQRSYDKDGEKKTVLELEVDEIGPSLRYATATVKKMSRTSGSSGQQGSGQRPATTPDPWASQDTPAPF